MPGRDAAGPVTPLSAPATAAEGGPATARAPPGQSQSLTPTTDSVEPPPAPQSFDSPTCGNGRKTNRVAKGSPWVSGFLVDTAASPAKAAAPWAPRRGSHFSRFGGGRLGPRRFWKEARAEGRAAAGEGSSPGNRRAGPRPAGAGPVTGDRPRQGARRRGGWAGGRSAHGCKKASRCPRLDACAAPANRKSGPREPGERSRSPCWGWREKGDSAYYASRQPPRQEAGAAAYYASREPPRQEARAASYYASREPPRRAGGASVTREAEVEAEPTWSPSSFCSPHDRRINRETRCWGKE